MHTLLLIIYFYMLKSVREKTKSGVERFFLFLNKIKNQQLTHRRRNIKKIYYRRF